MFSSGRHSATVDEILAVRSELEIARFYLDIPKIPCLVCSPLRPDKKPSFSITSRDGQQFRYKDFSTGESGGVFSLLMRLWHCSFTDAISKIYKDLVEGVEIQKTELKQGKRNRVSYNASNVKLKCRVRPWRDYDIAYWKSYGITKEWLEYAEVYPVSQTILEKGKKVYTFTVDKYAYAYVEHKSGRTTLKIYQPYNTDGYKWMSKHKAHTVSLWTKIPQSGSIVCICSSLKDALCLWCNTGIPSIALQGEGYSMTKTAVKELKKRFKHVCILFDADGPGVKDSVKLAEETGFINVLIPKLNGQKDISDFYKSLDDKSSFKELILNYFRKALKLT